MPLPDSKDRTVVITGASRGLGAGMAEELARAGLRLGLCARGAPILADGPAVLACQLDVADADAVDAFARQVAERFGGIDLWINNAGLLEPVRFVRDLEPDELLAHLSVNVIGVLNGSRAFSRHLRATGQHGVLVNISSGAAHKGYAGWGAYCAGKAAVDRLSECMQLEEQDAGLRVHAVAPGIIDTDMQAAIRAKTPAEFPMVSKFVELKRREAFNSPSFVARQLLTIAFDPEARPDQVVVRLPDEPRD